MGGRAGWGGRGLLAGGECLCQVSLPVAERDADLSIVVKL